jgi:membrane protein
MPNTDLALFADRLKPEADSSESGILSPRYLAWIFLLATDNFIANNDLLWASALTYTAILSIVPVLALAFSVVKRLAGLEQIQPLILHYIALDSPQLADKLMSLITHINAAALGTVGATALLITDITTLGTIERAFNHIWKVPRGRSYLRKFTDYLSVTFTVPVLLTLALGLSASFAQYGPFHGLSSALPFLLVWPGFLFLFVFFPYTKVLWQPALLGSFVAAALWQLAQVAYVHFQVHLASSRVAYGALAAVPVLFVWLYISWVIVLFGVEICAAAQYRTPARQTFFTPDFIRGAGLLIMTRVGERLLNRRDTVNSESLAQELNIAEYTLTPLLQRLKRSGLIVEGQSDNQREHGRGLFLTRDPGVLTLDEILSVSSGRGETRATDDIRIVKVMDQLDVRDTELLGSMTLRDLLGEEPAGSEQIRRARSLSRGEFPQRFQIFRRNKVEPG